MAGEEAVKGAAFRGLFLRSADEAADLMRMRQSRRAGGLKMEDDNSSNLL